MEQGREASRKGRTVGFWFLTLFLFTLTSFFFVPATDWIIRSTLLHEQLKHAFIILALAGALLFMENKKKLKLCLQFGDQASGCLMLSFVLLAVSGFFKLPLLVLPAYSLAVAAWVIFVFGQRVARITLALLSAFTLYTAFAVMLPLFDWPLRLVAGENCRWLLGVLGFDTQLGLVERDGVPVLLLLVGGRGFEVAAECNGFGMISGGALLALLLVIYRRVSYVRKIAGMVAAVLVGGIFNILRIMVICIFAPLFPNHYLLMHETVGNVFFWSALGLIWWMINSMAPVADGKDASVKAWVLFDGECGLCDRFVRFCAWLDKQGVIMFAPLQGNHAARVRARHGDFPAELSSMVVVTAPEGDAEKIQTKYTAVRTVLHAAGGFWKLLSCMMAVVPKSVGDHAYDFVAANRIRWFGRKDVCAMPSESLRRRLLD